MKINTLSIAEFIRYLLLFSLFSQIISCSGTESTEHKTLVQERAAQADWQSRRFSLSGMVYDLSGAAVPDAIVSFDTVTSKTDASGYFELANLSPSNALLLIKHADFRNEQLAVNMLSSVDSTSIVLEPIRLTRTSLSQVRFLFGGDVSFGRRFLDPEEITPPDQVPPDNPEAPIQSSSPVEGTRKIMQWIKPWYEEADWGVLNLETPVTDNPSTPHPNKSFVFFTLPDSLNALSEVGVDYVSLGNNHVYDYLQGGLDDTLFNLDAVGIKYSGAGKTVEQAFTAHREVIKDQGYAFISATSVSGDQYAPTNYVANASKGGAADLREDDDVINAIQTASTDGFTPIVQWHTGKEYTFTPTKYAAGRMSLAAKNGAALVVSHHPHVAQGVSIENGVVILEGLGNLAFDQNRLETFLGLMARVDMSADQVAQLRLLPVYLKQFAPLPISGDLANRFIRRIGEFSDGRGALVYPYQSQGMVSLNMTDISVSQQSVNVVITIPDSGISIVDLRQYASSEFSISKFETAAPSDDVTFRMGRDIMLFGDFEDWDVDEQNLASNRWDVPSASRFICLSYAYRGLAGLCSIRDETNQSDSVTAFRNRIRVMGDALDTPNKELSLLAYIKGDNAGEVTITARYYASTGSQSFGEETIINHAAGSFDWSMLSADLTMPSDDAARATRIFIRHAPPLNGEATVAFDELALINWEEEVVSAEVINTPHARDFIRVEGEAGREINLSLTFSRYLPEN